MEYFILIIISLTLYLVSKKINTLIFKQSNNILINTFIFSYFFLIIYLIFSFFFIFNIDGQIISYVIIFFIFFGSLFLRNEIFNLVKNFNLKIIKKNKIIFLAVFLYFLLILFPAYDEDSLRYHLAIAKKINNNTFYENTWLDYLVVGAHEFINSFSLHLKFEKISSYSNFIFLIFIIFYNYYILKKYKVGSGILSSFILLACPYLLSLLSSQKFFLLPCYIVTYSLAYLYLEKNIKISIIYLLLFINIFCSIIKPTFIPYLVLLGFWSLYKIKDYKNRILYCFFGIIFTVICYAPLYIIKSKIYNDPFLIFFSNNPNNYEWFYEYREFLSKINMDYSDKIKNQFIKFFILPVKLILPLHFSDISKTLGLGLLFLFSIDFKKNKNIFYLIILFILSVLMIENLQNRWFLPLLIFISIFANTSRIKYLFLILKLQVVCLIIVLIPLSFLTFLESFNIIEKKFILNNFLKSHHQYVEKINNKYKGEKIFSTLNDFYNLNNVVPVYYPDLVVKYDKNFYKRNENNTKLILWNNYALKDIDDFIERHLSCKSYEKVEEISYNDRRIYFMKSYRNLSLYKLKC